MSNKLNLFSKLRLSIRARRDVRLDLFRNFDVSDPDSGLEDHFVISNFITYELGRYEQLRTRLHTCKRCLIWTPIGKTRLRRYQLMPPSHAITLLSGVIANLQAQVHLTYAEFNKTMDVLQEQTDQYLEDKAPHYVRVCFNESIEARTKFQKVSERLFSRAVLLLNQKIRILTKLENRAEILRSRYFQRIRYYYERASAREPKLPVQYLGEDRFNMITDVYTIRPEYVQELADSYTLRDQLTKEIDDLFP